MLSTRNHFFVLLLVTLILAGCPKRQPDPVDEKGIPITPTKIKGIPISPMKFVERPINDKPFSVGFTENDMNITFSLRIHVTVREKEAKAFDRRYEHCVQEVSDRVDTVLRASTPMERQEVEHTTIRDRLKREINNVLQTPWVVDVLISEPAIKSEPIRPLYGTSRFQRCRFRKIEPDLPLHRLTLPNE